MLLLQKLKKLWTLKVDLLLAHPVHFLRDARFAVY